MCFGEAHEPKKGADADVDNREVIRGLGGEIQQKNSLKQPTTATPSAQSNDLDVVFVFYIDSQGVWEPVGASAFGNWAFAVGLGGSISLMAGLNDFIG